MFIVSSDRVVLVCTDIQGLLRVVMDDYLLYFIVCYRCLSMFIEWCGCVGCTCFVMVRIDFYWFVFDDFHGCCSWWSLTSIEFDLFSIGVHRCLSIPIVVYDLSTISPSVLIAFNNMHVLLLMDCCGVYFVLSCH